MRGGLILILMLLAGCSLREAPLVDGRQPVRIWSPPPEALPPVAQILVLHGFGDHLTTFEDTGSWLARQGMITRAYDLAGFGARPDHGFWPGNAALAAQLRDEIADARRAWPDLPLIVLGESMGAAVAILGTTGRPDLPVDGLILVAPAVWGGTSMSGFNRAALNFLVRTFPGLRLSSRGLPIQASDNIAVLIRNGRDPLFLKQPTAAMVGGLVALMDEVAPLAGGMSLPTLVLMGDRDQVVPPTAQRSFTSAIGSADCTAVTYPDGWHLLLDDYQRETVWRDLGAWIRGGVACPQTCSARATPYRPCRMPRADGRVIFPHPT